MRRLLSVGSFLLAISVLVSGCVELIPSTAKVVNTPTPGTLQVANQVSQSAPTNAAVPTVTNAATSTPATASAPIIVPSPTLPPPTATAVQYAPTVVQPTRTPAPPKPTATNTVPPAPPTATAIPPTPVPSMPYSHQDTSWLPNCGMIQILIVVKDSSGNTKDGMVARYETVDGLHGARSNATGSKGPGMTDFTVNPVEMRAATWRVWIVDGSDNQASPKVDVTSNTEDCTGGGHQVATVYFKQN